MGEGEQKSSTISLNGCSLIFIPIAVTKTGDSQHLQGHVPEHTPAVSVKYYCTP